MATEQCMKRSSKHSINTVFYIPLENTLIFTFCMSFLYQMKTSVWDFWKSGEQMEVRCSIPIFQLYFLLIANQTTIQDPGAVMCLKERAQNNLHMKCVRARLYHSGATKGQDCSVRSRGILPSKPHSSALSHGVLRPIKWG